MPVQTLSSFSAWPGRGGVAAADLAGRLRLVREAVEGRVVLTTSFGIEDQAITHAIAVAGLDIDIVTLDTGRLFPETYAVWAETERRYGRRIRAVYPHGPSLEVLVELQGIDGFYGSLEARKACCGVRKVEPLRRALDGAAVWIAGLRAGQSAERGDISFVAFDQGFAVWKASPLFDWTRERLDRFVAEHGVPVNALHARGFPSIGCAPCSRAIAPGEPERAGRWWWEDDVRKECGLHVGADGRLVRSTTGEAVA